MSSSFDEPEVDAFRPGAQGEPGARVFYLQWQVGDRVVSVKCEKEQVSGLADHFERQLADLPSPAGPVPSAPMELAEPVLAEWTVGTIGLGVDEERGIVLVVLEELVPDDAVIDDPGRARLRLTSTQLQSFVGTARELVAGGRPRCPRCGRPMNPDGHICPRSNGHHLN